MKKRFLTLLLALIMLLSLAACGGGGDSTQSDASGDSPGVSDEETVDPDEETADPDEEGDEIDISNWACYMGVMDDDSTIYYAFDETGTRGALMVLSSDYTSSISVIGDCGYDEESGIEYITDDETGLTISYSVIDNGDGSYSLDFGDLGTAIVAESDPQQVLDGMDIIAEETTDVTEDFIASLGL